MILSRVILSILLITLSNLYLLEGTGILQRCLDVGAANEAFQNKLYDFLVDPVIGKRLFDYEDKTFMKDDRERELEHEYCYLYVKEKTGLLALLDVFESKNHHINDVFWDSMMEVLPPTWHVYGARPMKMSIINGRFFESCASNLFSFYKDRILEKYHTALSNLKDVRILTMGKIIEICRNIREKMVSVGFDIDDNLHYFSKSDLAPYYRCSSIDKDNFADILIVLLGRYKGYITKSRACSIVDSFEKIQDLGDINDNSCYEELRKHLFGRIIPTGGNQKNEAYILCRELQLLRKLTYSQYDNFSSMILDDSSSENKELENSSDVEVVDLALTYLKNTFEKTKTTQIGEKMSRVIKIDRKRFVESCVNNIETLFATGGIVFDNSDRLDDSDKEDEEGSSILKSKLKYETSLVDLRNKLFVVCSSLQMHILNSKISGFRSTKVANPRLHSRSDIFKMVNSAFLIFDRCRNDQNITGEKYVITQDTISEIILTIIFYSSEDSLSSIALYNGFSKASICELSDMLVRAYNEDINNQEPNNFLSVCRSITLNYVLEQRGDGIFERKKLRKSITKVCSILISAIKEMSAVGVKREGGLDSSYYDLEPLSGVEIGLKLKSHT
ncbi:hypothetical protein FG386_001038 [Cryptosporidium ryanae]|uniref:uncharacterized protein n=1 Tax=Cryptosporidium ryanae TaxID=515981 RepID=UPI00351A6D4A|nr:hypothetical protein FG386_001038 [Cryptosporidium ryanae]